MLRLKAGRLAQNVQKLNTKEDLPISSVPKVRYNTGNPQAARTKRPQSRKGGDEMSLEAVQQVTRAEEEARQIKAQAVQNARQQMVQAKLDAEQIVQQACAKAQQEAAELMHRAQDQADADAEQQLDAARRECDALQMAARERLDEAVRCIIERVVDV